MLLIPRTLVRGVGIPLVSFEDFGDLLLKTVWKGTILGRRKLVGLLLERVRIDYLRQMWGVALVSVWLRQGR